MASPLGSEPLHRHCDGSGEGHGGCQGRALQRRAAHRRSPHPGGRRRPRARGRGDGHGGGQSHQRHDRAVRRLLLSLVVVLAGCGGEAPIIVGVASSMAEAADELASDFGQGPVEVSVAGSQILVSQVREGAPLDVVLTADEATASELVRLQVLATDPIVFATNRLAIAVAPGNPHAISGIEDLANPDLTVVLAAPQVPAGRYTAEMLEAAGVAVTPSSLEPSVRSVLAKVQLGEADAGIVYRTDISRGDVAGVEIPDTVSPVAEYYAAALATSAQPETAAAFVAFLTTPAARALLAEFGFSP
ncbi:MAG: molybdate ABC transporter substrate-binding protein [Acidimicrobiia bacterium]|nr:molybdate ABC transporter substrate-binding protein [Acidimicrobiia bacterium]